MATVADVAAAFKAALVAASTTATATLGSSAVAAGHTFGVFYGHPGTQQLPDDIVSWGRVTSSQEPGPISATNRSRTNNLAADVTISVFRSGGADQEQVASEAAYAYLSAIEEYLRVTDPTLGGLVLWCFCTGHDSDGVTDPILLAQGRTIEITATFSAFSRIHS